MENCPKIDGVKSSFTLTSKVISQGAFEKENNGANRIGDYVSTVNQASLVTEEQNDAIRNNCLANFRLNSSSAVNSYNAAVKKA